MATQAAVGGAGRSVWLLARARAASHAAACTGGASNATRLPGARVVARPLATDTSAVVASRRHVAVRQGSRAFSARRARGSMRGVVGRAVHTSAACEQRHTGDAVGRGGRGRGGDAPSRRSGAGRGRGGDDGSEGLVYPISPDTAVRPVSRRWERAVGAPVDGDMEDDGIAKRGKRQVVKRPRYRHDPPGFHRDRKGRLVEDVLFPVDDGERLLCRRISEVALPSDVVDLVRSEADDAGLHAATTGLQRLSQLMAAPQHTLSRRKLAKIRAHAASAEDVRELCLLATEHLRVYLPASEESLAQRERGDASALPAVGPRTLSSLVWAAAKLGYEHTTLYDLALAHAEVTGLDKFTPRDISQLVNGLSRSPLSVKRRRDFLCEHLVPSITRNASEFRTNELSNLLCSFAATPLPKAPGMPGDVPQRKFFAFDPEDHGAAAQAAGGANAGAAVEAPVEGPTDLAAQRAAVGSMALALGARAVKSLAEARAAAAAGADRAELEVAGNYNGRRMPRKRAPPPPPPPSAQAVCNTVYGLARLRECAEDAVRARVVDGARRDAMARDGSAESTGPDPGASIVGDGDEPRSVYELLQALQEEVLVAIGTGRGKLDASPLGVMQAVWAYVDAAEAHLAHLESVGTPQRPSDVLNALVLRKACKAFALYHCNSAAARQSPHVVVAMLGAMDRVKQLVSQELAADRQAALDAAASKRTLLVDPPGPESDLARLFTTSEDRTGAAVRLWYAAGCSADEFVDRLDATNLSVLVRCLQSLAPADAARTGTQRRALALPPHEAFGGVFAKVGFRAAELVDELPNRGLAVLMNIYAQHGGKAGQALFQAVMGSQQAQTRITRLNAPRMTDVVHSIATGPQPRSAVERDQRWHLLRGIGSRLSARITELDRSALATAIQAMGMCHDEVDVFTLTAARAATAAADKLDRRRAASWLGRVVPGLVDLGLHVPVIGGGVADGDAGTTGDGSAAGVDARTAGVCERLVPGAVLFPTPVRSAASSRLVPTVAESEARDGREARRNRMPLAESVADSTGYRALDELARVTAQRLEDGGFDDEPEALCLILRSVAAAGLTGGVTPHGLELLQQTFYSGLQSASGAEQWANALTRALALGNTGSAPGFLPPRFEAPLASLFVAHSLWGHWMRSVDHAERAAVTTSRASAGALSGLLRFGRGALERQELEAAATPSRRKFVSSIVGALEGTNARMVTGALSAPTGVAVDVAIAVGGDFEDSTLDVPPTGASGQPRLLDPTAVGQAVALQVGDGSKFLGGSRMPRATAQAQCAMLHADGWLVVPVPAWEWVSLAQEASTADMQRFLHRKIQRQLLRE